MALVLPIYPIDLAQHVSFAHWHQCLTKIFIKAAEVAMNYSAMINQHIRSQVSTHLCGIG